MFVVLGVFLVGIGYGLITKSKDRLLLHRWNLSVVVALASGAILLVMLPSAYNFFIDPNFNFSSSLSIFLLIHGVLGAPAISFGLLYAFGDLPQKIRSWMRLTAIFWTASFVLGIIVFLEMMGFLPL